MKLIKEYRGDIIKEKLSSKKILKYAVCIFLIILISSPILVRDKGISPEDYISNFEIDGGKFVEVNNYKTYYIDVNTKSENTIVLLHGFGGSSTNWLPVIPSLEKEGYRVVAVDLKGFGLSQKKSNEDYSHPSQVEFVDSFVNKLELKKFILVGHSMGGNIAIMYYQKYPGKVEKLILVSASIMDKKEDNTMKVNALKILDWPIIREYVRVIMKVVYDEDRISSTFKSAMYKQVEIEEPLFVNPTLFKGWEYVLIKITSSRDKNVLTKPLEEIDVPTFLIWGEEDTWVPVSNGYYLKERIPNSRLEVIGGVGHLPMFEDPEKLIDAFMSSLEG
ncbi:MAG: Proline iminopeptidase [Candidatus Methanofastidiosum methylothiophilum]|uniref:Proline iminopeptidase n=1 Tax=Candidatus Methanofastidiosum methylothiophilum TaxID=1705564 RepID=A0A150ILP7_9EURY|nr:MAG: Proline iminopeptidase [Candidatus Methanofastidiosum methylthiophilus]